MATDWPRNAALRLANRCVRTPGASRRKWTHEEELLLLRLFRVYGHSWHRYVSHYSQRNVASIKNKYYALMRRGDARNWAIYGDMALSDELLEAPERPRRVEPSLPAALAWHVSSASISDLSTIEYKTSLQHNEPPASAYDYLTPDPTSPSAGSEHHTSRCFSATIPLDRPSVSESGAATPPLLSNKEPVALPDSELSALHLDDDPHALLRSRTLAPLYPALSQVHYISPPAIMFTLPFHAFDYKNSQPIAAYAPSVLPPVQYYLPFVV